MTKIINFRMSVFTCISCQVAFNDDNAHRMHYKSDWHRYNLKRKVVDLPPVSSDDFQVRVLKQRAIDNQEVSNESKLSCRFCNKSFGNLKTYENHLQSKKHKSNEVEIDIENVTEELFVEKDDEVKDDDVKSMDTESVDSDEWDEVDDNWEDTENPINYNNCLFCDHHSGGLHKNIKHMSNEHSFFIPDVEYCIDLHGLLSYLAKKIMKYYMCLWCNISGKAFFSADAARQHMLDKGHTKMLHEGLVLAEYAEFYDYSKSYPDAEEAHPDEEVEVDEIDGNDYQLVLPSGAVVGHRSLMRYYKQSIDPNRSVVPVRRSKLHKVLAHYKSLGWTESQQAEVAKKARDIQHMNRVVSKWNMRLSVKANKFQKHYRAQVNF